MKMQEELATLMIQHMKLDNNNVDYHPQPKLPPTPPQPDQPMPMTYITQHYHHSAHQAASTPPIEPTSVYDDLARHGIDGNALFPSQLHLFKEAQPEQQVRLIQLWSISPPSPGNQSLARDLGTWPPTSMQQEEETAKARYLRMQGDAEGHHSPEHRPNAEPYIVHGYESSPDASGAKIGPGSIARSQEYNRALDPAYQSREWWMHESDPIEHQYGVVQQMKHFGDQDEDMS